jgi:pimeloyl-ACP methyl ester carboxylesterase
MREVFMGYQSGFIKTQEAPPVRLHYIEANHRPDAPLILMLHGFPETSLTWQEYLTPLAQQGFHPVALDLRGYSQSSHPSGQKQYDLDVLVKDIREVIAYFHRPTFLVGHDWGGIITLELAEKYPELCKGIVIINAPHAGTMLMNMKKSMKLSIKQSAKFWYALFFQLPLLPEAMLKRSNYRPLAVMIKRQAVNKEAYSEEDLREYRKAYAQGLTPALNYYRRNLFKLLFRQKSLIETRGLLIWGEKDITLHREITKGMEKFFKGKLTTRYFKEASHWVHRERTPEVCAEMVSFFRSFD